MSWTINWRKSVSALEWSTWYHDDDPVLEWDSDIEMSSYCFILFHCPLVYQGFTSMEQCSELFFFKNLYFHTYVAPAAEAAVSSFEILFLLSFLLLVPYTPIHEPSSSKRPERRISERWTKEGRYLILNTHEHIYT